MDPLELIEIARLMRKLGMETEVDVEEARAYLPDISDIDEMRNFYIPQVPKNFYYNPNVFRRLLGIR